MYLQCINGVKSFEIKGLSMKLYQKIILFGILLILISLILYFIPRESIGYVEITDSGGGYEKIEAKSTIYPYRPLSGYVILIGIGLVGFGFYWRKYLIFGFRDYIKTNKK